MLKRQRLITVRQPNNCKMARLKQCMSLRPTIIIEGTIIASAQQPEFLHIIQLITSWRLIISIFKCDGEGDDRHKSLP